MSAVNPLQRKRRSMLYRWHERHGASFAEHAGAIIVANYSADADERSAASELGLCDLSTLPRWGVTGRGATAWLADRGWEVPTRANRASWQANADVLARLSDDEYLLLASGLLAGDEAPDGIPDAPGHASGPVYGLPRQDSHSWFAVTGHRAPALLATVCGVDMRDAAFGNGAVAQTSIARTSAIVLRADLGDTACYFVLGGSTSAEYLWDALAGALEAPGGAVIGIRALRSLFKRQS
ncbi:MAG: sarcosine oxidase [Woeseiaceae bacterium]|nr:sarcosine oxidase [Woeseiaceae bacterium]